MMFWVVPDESIVSLEIYMILVLESYRDATFKGYYMSRLDKDWVKKIRTFPKIKDKRHFFYKYSRVQDTICYHIIFRENYKTV